MKRFFLSRKGNILVANGESYFFMNSSFEFMRISGKSEYDFISAKASEIKFEKEPVLPEVLYWKYLWSTEIKNYSECIPGSSSDGGNYSYKTTNRYFVRKRSRRAIEFCRLQIETTSSSFSYTDDGDFDEEYSVHTIVGIDLGEEEKKYRTKRFGRNNGQVSLDQIVDLVEKDEVLLATNTETPSEYDSDGNYVGSSPTIVEELSKEEMIRREKILENILGLSLSEISRPRMIGRKK
jgi:hypothetical protein